MSENTQSYSAKGEVSNITKRRTRFERIKIALSCRNLIYPNIYLLLLLITASYI